MTQSRDPDFSGMACPVPQVDSTKIQMAHGGGGRLTQQLVEGLFLRRFDNPALREQHDGAVLALGDMRLAFSTDSYVVRPMFFPGGDIGSLAVHGTVNDLAMCGARPVALSAGFILEEGLATADLERITASMEAAAAASGVSIVTGDTKVVDRGKGDGVYINTAGIGLIAPGVEVGPRRARVGDKVILSGEIALHGIAIVSVREGLEFETTLESDTAAVWPLVEPLLAELGGGVHVLRDPTRGGVASALNEIAQAARVGILLEESRLPIRDEVRGACELLGFDPLYVANEGKFVAVVAPDAAERALEILRSLGTGREAAIVGEVVGDHAGKVHLRSGIGGQRVVDMLSGEQLPRIC